MDPIALQLPADLAGKTWHSINLATWALLAHAVAQFLGRAFTAVRSGGGLRGIFSSIWMGSATATTQSGQQKAESGIVGAVRALFAMGLIGLMGLMMACAPLQPGADPIEVRAEQTIGISGDTFDEFLKLEMENRDLVLSKAPAIDNFAEYMREQVTDVTDGATNTWARDISWVNSANQTRIAYKTNRTAANKASLTTALAVLEQALAQTQAQLAALGTNGIHR